MAIMDGMITTIEALMLVSGNYVTIVLYPFYFTFLCFIMIASHAYYCTFQYAVYLSYVTTVVIMFKLGMGAESAVSVFTTSNDQNMDEVENKNLIKSGRNSQDTDLAYEPNIKKKLSDFQTNYISSSIVANASLLSDSMDVEDIESVDLVTTDSESNMQVIAILSRKYIYRKLENVISFIIPELRKVDNKIQILGMNYNAIQKNSLFNTSSIISINSIIEDTSLSCKGDMKSEMVDEESCTLLKDDYISGAQSSDNDNDIDNDALQVPLYRAIGSLVVCIIFLGLSATIIINLCECLSHLLGIGGSTVGATLVAIGSEVSLLVTVGSMICINFLKMFIIDVNLWISLIF